MLWIEYQNAFDRRDHSWLPTTPEFAEDMLNVVPPAYMGHHPVLGFCFATGEAWKHVGPDAVFLWCRHQPATAARMATFREFFRECGQLLPAEWIPVSRSQQDRILRDQGGEPYQSQTFRQGIILGAFPPGKAFWIPEYPGLDKTGLFCHPSSIVNL